MAGDWIKIEHATLDKPEISIAADILGISDGDAFFLFVRYWVWVDQNLDEARSGLVPFVSRRSLDRKFNCPGFSGTLEAIGWATFDDEQQILCITNWANHNGNTAKSRALEQKKKAKQRASLSRFRPDCVPASSGPEKRREENIKPIEAPSKKRLEEPTPEHQALADSLGVACKVEFAKYRDWLAANGKRQKDEAAGFRNWIRKAAEFRPTKPQLVEPQRHGSHVPAKLPVNEPHTEMPEHIRAQLSSLTGKLRVS